MFVVVVAVMLLLLSALLGFIFVSVLYFASFIGILELLALVPFCETILTGMKSKEIVKMANALLQLWVGAEHLIELFRRIVDRCCPGCCAKPQCCEATGAG